MISVDRTAPQTIGCHDCGNTVSFTARACPHCGSVEPTGSYRLSRKEAKNFRIEQTNDATLLAATAGGALLGLVFGFVTGNSALGAILPMAVFGLIGTLFGMLAGFAFNLLRRF